jgi:ubiquinone/menaquinone biosynthesis C-methylase UbiE
MFTKTAEFYDAIYSWKDYAKESQLLVDFIARYRKSAGNKLLDVACGTGAHIAFLKNTFSIEGLDLDANMLAIARSKFPEIAFHHGNMLDFDLADRFDVVACLFSSIGYVKKIDLLHQAIGNMARHLVPGGVLAIEPWLTPEKIEGGKRPPVHSMFVDKPGLKIARLNETVIRNGIFRSNFHYLIGQEQRIFYRRERHELGLFTHQQYLDSFLGAGLDVHHDEQGLMGRGLYLGVLPS